MLDAAALLQIPLLELNKELFRRKDYDFIAVKDGHKHIKQEEALNILTDSETTEFNYGGAAGGAKSWTGASWLLFMSLIYPDTRWFIGREELKRLRDSTLLTFFKVAKAYGVERDKDYKYNGQDHYIQFTNGSRIDLLDLKFLPSDPLFERYGSIEYTGGWIEEGGEVNFGAYDTLKSRIGRHLNDKYGIIGKIFVTCNPKKNWIYSYFWRPYKEDRLKKGMKFLQALLKDNPHIESGYEQQLMSLTDVVKKQRLLYGNFEYDDDPSALCDYDAIMDMFTNEHVKGDGKKYLSADLAMKGRDRFVSGVWDGFICDLTKGVDKGFSTGKEIEGDLKRLMITHNVPRSQVVADSDGMGSYLESYLTGIKEFHGGSSAINKTEYANLKSECGYKLAEVINRREIKIICTPEQAQKIAEEIAVLKADDVDADEKKKRIIPKDTMKELLGGRSPDYLDMLLMRMLFAVKRQGYNISYV